MGVPALVEREPGQGRWCDPQHMGSSGVCTGGGGGRVAPRRARRHWATTPRAGFQPPRSEMGIHHTQREPATAQRPLEPHRHPRHPHRLATNRSVANAPDVTLTPNTGSLGSAAHGLPRSGSTTTSPTAVADACSAPTGSWPPCPGSSRELTTGRHALTNSPSRVSASRGRSTCCGGSTPLARYPSSPLLPLGTAAEWYVPAA